MPHYITIISWKEILTSERMMSRTFPVKLQMATLIQNRGLKPSKYLYGELYTKVVRQLLVRVADGF